MADLLTHPAFDIEGAHHPIACLWCRSHERCSECHGTGAVMSYVDDEGGEHIEECDECDGAGYFADELSQVVGSSDA